MSENKVSAPNEYSAFKQGEVQVDSVTLVNQEMDGMDLSTICTNIKLYEGIDKTFVSGRISIVDAHDLIKYFKITGQESLTIRIKARDEDATSESPFITVIDRVFKVYAISDGKVEGNMQYYTLSFIDPNAFIAEQKRISQTLRGSYSDILLKVWQEHVKWGNDPNTYTDHWEQTSPATNAITVPNWTINQLITYILSNASGDKMMWKNSYFFFDTVCKPPGAKNKHKPAGQYRFMSLKTMANDMQIPVAFDPYPRTAIVAGENISVNMPQQGLNTQILHYERPQTANTRKGAVEGAYASKLIAYDPIRKMTIHKKYSIKDVYNRDENTEPLGWFGWFGYAKKTFPIIRTDFMSNKKVGNTKEKEDGENYVWVSPPDATGNTENKVEGYVNDPGGEIAANALTVMKINMTNAYSDDDKLFDKNTATSVSNNWVGDEWNDTGPLERHALLSLFEQQNVKVSIPFRPDIVCGSTIQLNIPTYEPEDERIVNKFNTGAYIITKAVYDINPIKNTGVIQLNCVKDSFAIDLTRWYPREELNQKTGN